MPKRPDWKYSAKFKFNGEGKITEKALFISIPLEKFGEKLSRIKLRVKKAFADLKRK